MDIRHENTIFYVNIDCDTFNLDEFDEFTVRPLSPVKTLCLKPRIWVMKKSETLLPSAVEGIKLLDEAL
jgi:hypothetical protein